MTWQGHVRSCCCSKRKHTVCRDHRESGVSVPDGEIQEFNCCLWFHNQVVSLCLCLCWLSCCERSQRGLGASHRVPQKNKWVSCLSIVRYWVSGLECSQCAKVAGRGECSLVFLTWWDGLRQRGDWRILFLFLFFSQSDFTNKSVELFNTVTLDNASYEHIWLLPGTYMCTVNLSLIVTSFHCVLVNTMTVFRGQSPNIEFCPRVSKAMRTEVEEQWWRMDDLFCFSWTTK